MAGTPIDNAIRALRILHGEDIGTLVTAKK